MYRPVEGTYAVAVAYIYVAGTVLVGSCDILQALHIRRYRGKHMHPPCPGCLGTQVRRRLQEAKWMPLPRYKWRRP